MAAATRASSAACSGWATVSAAGAGGRGLAAPATWPPYDPAASGSAPAPCSAATRAAGDAAMAGGGGGGGGGLAGSAASGMPWGTTAGIAAKGLAVTPP